MDTDKLVAHSRARFDHAAAKRVLKEKYEAKLIFAYNGGMFRAGPDLINTITSFPNSLQLVLQDLYGNPVKIDSSPVLQQAKDLWLDTMREWLAEYELLNKKR
jgi:hypothetical protein